MVKFRRWFLAAAAIALSTGLATAQIGVINGPGYSTMSCVATAAGAPELRPEGYTELLGDIVVQCRGGSVMPAGAAIPTTNITVSVSPSVPITSRILGDNGASEAMLIIDETGSNIATGSTGGYGPQAPQSLCTTVQQQDLAKPCQAYAAKDTSGQYPVAVVEGTSTPAQNVYQGKIGDYGANSVTFYNVPVLPPAYSGVSRTFRITNLRIPIPGGSLTGTVDATVSTSPSEVLPITGSVSHVGIIGPGMYATLNAAPAGGGNPFPGCVPQTNPALAAQVTFTEGFATAFKTRVVPGGEGARSSASPYAAEAQNLAAPSNQNIPGSYYSGYVAGSESGFILPAAYLTVSNVTYTAGLTDYGTRLKAVFTNIPPGMTMYVSTANRNDYAVPGGNDTTSYAVLVATSQSNEADDDGRRFTPLSSAIAGSDGLMAYPLTPDALGRASAIWEVVNANPSARDALTFSVYVTYTGTSSTMNLANVALSFAPEPAGGTFSTTNSTQGLTSPAPRFAVLWQLGGTWPVLSSCSLSASSAPVSFAYSLGASPPPSQTRSVTFAPGNLPITVTPMVTTPTGGNWLSASLGGGTLTISANPSGLAASSTAYTGTVKLSAPGLSDVLVPVILTVSQTPVLTIAMTHTGNFAKGQLGAAYTIRVDNSAPATSTSGAVTVQEQAPSGLTLESMAGAGWDCSTLPYCKRSDALAAGGEYPPITVLVNVAGNAASPQVNAATVSGGGSAPANTSDSTIIVAAPVWTLGMSHSGNFIQGQTNAVYTVTVTNGTAGATTGAMTVTEAIPDGLTLVSMAGNGWDCSAPPSCSRNNVLTAGASYPPIIVTVNAAANAPFRVTNLVTATGGGLQAAIVVDLTVVDTPAVPYLISTFAGGLPAPTAVGATQYGLQYVSSVRTDPFGDVYLSSSTLNCVFKLDPNGTLTRVAGNGVIGFSGDGGPAVNAQLNNPNGLAIDSSGNLYIADQGNNRIRKVSPSGVITTVAGTGDPGYSGDNVNAATAQLNLPADVAVDAADNLYIADTDNYRIREVSNGIITTVAGTGISGRSVNGAAAVDARLLYPSGITFDSAGALYIADFVSQVHKVAAGTITDFAGTVTPGYSGDNGPAATAQLNVPAGLSTDSAGNLYIADDQNRRIRKVAPNGVITTVAGGGSSGDNGPAVDAWLFYPQGVASDSGGNLYIADSSAARVRKVTPAGTITTVAGSLGVNQPPGDGGPAAFAGLVNAWDLVVDNANRLYISEYSSVRRVSSGAISTVGTLQPSGEAPLAVDSAGNIYFAAKASVGKIATDGSVTIVAGTGTAGYSGDGGPAVNAQLSDYITGVAVDPGGNLYIADVFNARVRKVTAAGVISTVAGNGTLGPPADSGLGVNVAIGCVSGLAVDAAGNLYMGDSCTGGVRKLATDGAIYKVAGGGAGGDGGPATNASTGPIYGLAVDSASNIYFATQPGTVRKVSAAGIISTIAGTGASGYAGDGGPALSALFGIPERLAVDALGRIYLGDFETSQPVVRVLTPAGVLPVLLISSKHSGNFVSGQSGATYTVTVRNAAGAGPTSGDVKVTEIVPAGLTLVSMSADGWGCSSAVCTRSESLPGGSSYPPITVTVNVDGGALPQVTQEVTVSGGGALDAGAQDPTFIGAPAAVLEISTSHSANFTQGQTNATYTVSVGNQFAAAPTSGTVSVTESLPGDLSLVSIGGNGWQCPTGTCTRDDALAGGAFYPPVTVTVSVAQNAAPQVSAAVKAWGGASGDANAVDVTPVAAVCAISGGMTAAVADVQHVINEALGVIAAVHDLNHDGAINVADIRKETNAALGLGCPYGP